MKLDMTKVKAGSTYSRQTLADLWGYDGYEALARGLVTPRGDNKIILFITEGDRQQQTVQKYTNCFDGTRLKMEGPEDHFAEERMLNASTSGDEIHLFHRDKPRDEFTYIGRLQVLGSEVNAKKPTKFTLEVIVLEADTTHV